MSDMSPLKRSLFLQQSLFKPQRTSPISSFTDFPSIGDSVSITGNILPVTESLESYMGGKNAIVETPKIGSFSGSIHGTQARESQKTENVPKYMSILDDVNDSLNWRLPWDDAQSLSSRMAKWGDTRDGALREFDQIISERDFAIADMMGHIAQINLEKAETQRMIEQKQEEKEQKKNEIDAQKNELEGLKDSADNQEIESKIKEADNKIGESQSKIGSKEEQISQIKEEMENNPDKKDELKAKIQGLESEVAEEKRNLSEKQAQKQELEARKQENEKKAEENRQKKEEKKSEQARKKEELQELKTAEQRLKDMFSTTSQEVETIQSNITTKQAELEKLQWIISDFTFKTQGMN
ncbi:MAG: hypothetical protein K8T10_17630 [Candidatus Eremiobacteraeota bacterium]|nr:hypothetical protein [Candidatus Eremiobacteraeota bacterium]